MRNLPKKEPLSNRERGSFSAFIPSIHCAPADQIPVTLIAFKHQFERTPVVSGHLFVQTGKVILHKTSLRIGGGHIFQRVSLHQNGVYRRLRGGSIVGIEDVALKILPSGQFNGAPVPSSIPHT